VGYSQDRQSSQPELQAICSTGINAFRLLLCYLKPVLPALTEKAEAFLNVEPLQWDDVDHLLTGHRLNKFQPLITRVETDKIQAMIDATQKAYAAQQEQATSKGRCRGYRDSSQKSCFDDFAKIDLRVARIIEAEHVEGADKLLALKLDLGPDQNGEPITRQVFSGIKSGLPTS
jgi:methionyl-tRNA synthetase